ncbi:transglutaminase-like cysteine peptidase [bacterium]|nr:transglutaminase-like cysteine peptidase [bacterium]MBU1884618.1 transglutaminase-like cysteine peptidase [bacterium]
MITKNRVLDYEENVRQFQELPKEKQILFVNRYLNQLLPKYDDENQQTTDYWETPKEFLITGYGDCEDYAIIKYYTLIKLGLNEKDLFLTKVYEKNKGGYHMVLSYFKNTNSSPLILDNLSFRVLPLEQRIDLQADVFIGISGVYRLNNKNTLLPLKKLDKKFQELQRKIIKEQKN